MPCESMQFVGNSAVCRRKRGTRIILRLRPRGPEMGRNEKPRGRKLRCNENQKGMPPRVEYVLEAQALKEARRGSTLA